MKTSTEIVRMYLGHVCMQHVIYLGSQFCVCADLCLQITSAVCAKFMSPLSIREGSMIKASECSWKLVFSNWTDIIFGKKWNICTYYFSTMYYKMSIQNEQQFSWWCSLLLNKMKFKEIFSANFVGYFWLLFLYLQLWLMVYI